MPSRPIQVDMPARVTAVDGVRPGGAQRLLAAGLAALVLVAATILLIGHLRDTETIIGIGAASVVALAIAVLLWIIGGRRYRIAGHLLSIWQGRLFLTAPGRSAKAIELSRARASVRLVGGVHGGQRDRSRDDERSFPTRPVHSSMSIRPGRYFVPLHPVLRLEHLDEDTVITVELCHVASRRMRNRDQLITLAEIVEHHTADNGPRAAGQLRTLARWQRLPHILDAEPDAVVVTPPDRPTHAPVLATPVRAGVPAAEIDIPGVGG
ncbi:hypothetical protein FB566_1155 [Stackebrandtia endophytica]|uniref:Uncharacterized protein n=1 Tax=Stackebrandtia endophytica TaxID=1496996 RepID=A0A543ASU2_9ACTN|nr:hypothetical protein [Stackebrandtia endophytica]TQL75644.1 hypothetical protein FB566_1155 [Stackebrandtia endophytica]